MNLNFVTLFYANYSAKGIALCRSIERVSPKSHLYVFAMDEVCFKILKSIELKNTTIISLAELEPATSLWSISVAFSLQKFSN